MSITTNSNITPNKKRRRYNPKGTMTTNSNTAKLPRFSLNDEAIRGRSPSSSSPTSFNTGQSTRRVLRLTEQQVQTSSPEEGAWHPKLKVHFAPPSKDQVILIPPTWNLSDREKSRLYYSTEELGRMATRERLRKQVAVLTVSLYRAQVKRLCRRGVPADAIPVHQVTTLYHKILVSMSARLGRLSAEYNLHRHQQFRQPCHLYNNEQMNTPVPPSTQGAVVSVKPRIEQGMDQRRPAKRRRREGHSHLYYYPTTATILTARAA